MKATGVIRKIDNLGRIVIPKEIRRNLRINDGECLEIFIKDNDLLLRKYSMIDNIKDISIKLVESFYKVFKKSIIITDKDKIISTSKDINNYLNKELSSNIKSLINSRLDNNINTNIIVGGSKENIYVLPIFSSYDILGSIILIDNKISEEDINNIKLLNSILLKYVEE